MARYLLYLKGRNVKAIQVLRGGMVWTPSWTRYLPAGGDDMAAVPWTEMAAASAMLHRMVLSPLEPSGWGQQPRTLADGQSDRVSTTQVRLVAGGPAGLLALEGVVLQRLIVSQWRQRFNGLLTLYVTCRPLSWVS